MKKSIDLAGESKREKITKLLQEHRSSLFQSFVTNAFEEDDYKTAGDLCSMMLVPHERHSSTRLGGLTFYALNDIEKLKTWVSKIVLEISNPTKLTLPTEIWLDQAFCVVTAHHLYRHLKIVNNKIDNFYKHIMNNINQEDSLIWENYYTDFMVKIEELNTQKDLLAKQAEEELLKKLNGLSVSAVSTSSEKGKKSKKKERLRKPRAVAVTEVPVVSEEEKEQARLANLAHQERLAKQAREAEEVRKKNADDARRGLENKATKDVRKREEEARIAAIESEKQSLPPLEFTVSDDGKGVTLISGTPGLWIPIKKYKNSKDFCRPSEFPLNTLGFIHEGVFYPLPKA